MSKVRIYSWNNMSRSARELNNRLGSKLLRRERKSHFVAGERDVIVVWGNSNSPSFQNLTSPMYLNHPYAVAKASDKYKCLDHLNNNSSARIPPYTTSYRTAHNWLTKGHEVIGRQNVSGSGGIGIVFMESVVDFVECPLYTKYIKKRFEFRVHVFRQPNGVLQTLTNKKVLRTTDFNGDPIDPENVDWKVRSYKNGFVFQRNPENVPDDVVEQAKKALDSLYLDFGAVDVIYNEKEGKAYVLEVNTAPGLEGQTLDFYTDQLQELINRLQETPDDRYRWYQHPFV